MAGSAAMKTKGWGGEKHRNLELCTLIVHAESTKKCIEGRGGVYKRDAEEIREPEGLWKAEDKIHFRHEEVRHPAAAAEAIPTRKLGIPRVLAAEGGKQSYQGHSY